MSAFAMPVYMLDYTPKTISSILSADAIDGKGVALDVYDRKNLDLKLEASGQRLSSNPDLFRVITEYEGVRNEHDWNFTILRESADRSRKKK
jgi:hypothetical protein